MRNIFTAKNTGPNSQTITLRGESADEAEVITEPQIELPVDMFRVDSKIIIKAPIVGAGIHDISVTISDNQLTIHKNSFREEPTKKEQYYIQECHWGVLSRTIDLPKEVDTERTRASLSDGILTVVMPILSNQHTKIINIKE